jgi:ribonuclease R
MTNEELNEKKELIVSFMNDKKYRPMHVKELASVLQVPRSARKDFKNVLLSLIEDGKINIDLKGRVKLLTGDALIGKFMSTRKGYGFVRIEGHKDDYFIPAESTKNAYNGDTVQIMIRDLPENKRPEAEVVRILERGRSIVVGTYNKLVNHGEVACDDQKIGTDIYIAKEDSRGAVTGHKVVVKITDYGNGVDMPKGEVVEILGHVNDPGVDIMSVVRALEIPDEYPQEVMDQAEHIEDEVSEEEKQGRDDYRSLMTVTIDGEESKDLDDAISLTKDDSGIYHLGVHIADVSNYVTEGSPIDKEALKRGNSVYLVDRVIPMIPHKLSNGICSLNQGVDRLTLSCMMDIDSKGNIISHKISESVINVDRRMTYTSVHRIVEENDPEETAKYAEFVDFFRLMYELADILHDRRQKNGSINFDFPESKITLDENGMPVDVSVYPITKANHIIEEFMLAANQTVAEEYYWDQVPFVYRIHESPSEEKIVDFQNVIENFGYTLKVKEDGVHPKEIQKLLDKIAGRPEEGLISMLALRSMKQARYGTECSGHFGLAMKFYCHFTSPIRRYADLEIHRIIKENIHGQLNGKRIAHYEKILPDVCSRISQLERRADEAERQVDDIKKAQYMMDKVGSRYSGIISGITSWGIFVSLPNTIEGMIRAADIPGDYYYYDEQSHSMIGRSTGRTYQLGQPVNIIVSGVDELTHDVDFVFDEDADKEKADSAGEDDNKEQKILPDNVIDMFVQGTQDEEPYDEDDEYSDEAAQNTSPVIPENSGDKPVAGNKDKKPKSEKKEKEGKDKKYSDKSGRKKKKEKKRSENDIFYISESGSFKKDKKKKKDKVKKDKVKKDKVKKDKDKKDKDKKDKDKKKDKKKKDGKKKK